jgi:hypothetical protein
MIPVFDLDPIRRSAGAVRTITALGHQAFEPELAGLPEQVRADLPALELGNENSFRTPRQQPRQVGLAQVQRLLPQIIALERQDVEGIELHVVVMSTRMQPVEIGYAIDAKQNRLAIDDE